MPGPVEERSGGAPDAVALLEAAAHEIRTPIAAIVQIAEALQAEDGALDGAERAEMLAHLSESARALDALVRDLLDVRRAEHGLLVAREPVDLVAVARRAAADAGVDAAVVPRGPATTVGDPVALERIIANLVSNARRHNPPGTRVWIRVAPDDDGTVAVCVEDDGRGVPDDLKEEIFLPFRRAGSSGTPGAGLGLTLARRFAEAHGGRLWVEDRAGGGARFTLAVPAPAGSRPGAGPARTASAGSGTPGAPPGR